MVWKAKRRHLLCANITRRMVRFRMWGHFMTKKTRKKQLVFFSKKGCAWSEKYSDWIPQYGILLSVENQIKANRVVSVSKVKPINEQHVELEFFTLTLKLVNKL